MNKRKSNFIPAAVLIFLIIAECAPTYTRHYDIDVRITFESKKDDNFENSKVIIPCESSELALNKRHF